MSGFSLLPCLLQEILQDKDGLNQRYFRKRALYLAHLADHLAQDPLFGSVRFSYARGCHLKPSLLLRPRGGSHTRGLVLSVGWQVWRVGSQGVEMEVSRPRWEALVSNSKMGSCGSPGVKGW